MARSAVAAQVPFEHLKDALNVDEEVLKRLLHSLSCGKYQVRLCVFLELVVALIDVTPRAPRHCS